MMTQACHIHVLVSYPEGESGNKTSHILACETSASFPGLLSPNAVEGLVKLVRRMTSGRHCI